jgi:hypothetical protein
MTSTNIGGGLSLEHCILHGVQSREFGSHSANSSFTPSCDARSNTTLVQFNDILLPEEARSIVVSWTGITDGRHWQQVKE